MTHYTPDNWFSLVNNIFQLISDEIDQIQIPSGLPEVLPKLIISIEFFRLLRGELFHLNRPQPIGDYQKEIYQMEGQLYQKLESLKTRVDPQDQKIRYYLDQATKAFQI